MVTRIVLVKDLFDTFSIQIRTNFYHSQYLIYLLATYYFLVDIAFNCISLLLQEIDVAS